MENSKDKAANVPPITIEDPPPKSRNILIQKVRPLSSYNLIHALWKRHIPQHVAQKFCLEITYLLENHTRYAVGFADNSGGYVLWNGDFVGGPVPLGTTCLFRESSTILAVFPDFLDFLSFLVITDYEDNDLPSFLVLNDAALFGSSREILEGQGHIYLFPTNDSIGDHQVNQAASRGLPFSDMRHLYPGHHTLSDWCCQSASRVRCRPSPISIRPDGPSP